MDFYLFEDGLNWNFPKKSANVAPRFAGGLMVLITSGSRLLSSKIGDVGRSFSPSSWETSCCWCCWIQFGASVFGPWFEHLVLLGDEKEKRWLRFNVSAFFLKCKQHEWNLHFNLLYFDSYGYLTVLVSKYDSQRMITKYLLMNVRISTNLRI